MAIIPKEAIPSRSHSLLYPNAFKKAPRDSERNIDGQPAVAKA